MNVVSKVSGFRPLCRVGGSVPTSQLRVLRLGEAGVLVQGHQVADERAEN